MILNSERAVLGLLLISKDCHLLRRARSHDGQRQVTASVRSCVAWGEGNQGEVGVVIGDKHYGITEFDRESV